MTFYYPQTAQPRIWRTTTTNVGSQDWVGESGETATLGQSVVDQLWDVRGGFMYDTSTGGAGYVTRPGYPDMAANADAGDLVVTYRTSRWWTGGSEPGVDNFSAMQYYFYGNNIDGLPGEWGGPGYHNTTPPGVSPMVPELNKLVFWEAYSDPDPNNDLDSSDSEPGWTEVDPTVAGLSRWATGWTRFTLNGATGAMSVEMSTDSSGIPTNWVTVATDTWNPIRFTGGPYNTFVEFNAYWTGGEPLDTGGIIVHDWKVDMAGVTEMEWTAATASVPMPINDPNWPIAGTALSPTVVLDGGAADHAIVDHPGIYLPWTPSASSQGADGGATRDPLWTSGPVLANPLILWSDHLDPGFIRRIEGVQPTDFYGLRGHTGFSVVTSPANGDYSSGWCWGICDLGDPLVGANFWADGSVVQEPTP